jgi:ABC-2 type transport system ATP-binding protein
MSSAIEASGLGKQYRRNWALRDCTLAIPEGHVVGLVGPNGAGKTTLLRLATGMLTPTRGTITVLGQRPAAGPAQLARVGFVAQDTAVYARLTVADHLRLGAWLNPGWDGDLAQRRIGRLALDPRARQSSQKATPTSRAACWSAPTGRSSTRPGRSRRSAWRTWCWPT